MQDNLELPFEFEEGRRYRGQPAGLEGVAQFERRQAPHAQPVAHALADGFGLFQFVGDVAGESCAGESAVEHVAGAGALFAQYPAHLPQVFVRGGAVCKRMTGVDEDAEPVLMPDVALQPVVLHRAFDETEVDTEVQQVGDDLLCVLEREAYLSVRVPPAEFGEQGGQEVVADRQAGA